ncbi:hypothetical protein GOBAR_DD12237 [Gossypium barbadense]|nr:hypothetical protein GOBAR_DD12237 [Gossypium barbadense]
MELVDNEEKETMDTLYCGNRSNQNASIQLFAEINIDLNAAIETDVVGNNGYDSSDPSNHEVDSDSDPDVDEVPNDINDEGVNDHIRHIVIRNNPGAHMSLIDPDVAHTAEFPGYLEILHAHQLVVDSDLEELRFQTLHYPCAHVVVVCAKVSLNVEQFIDEVYTLEHTFCVYENEFPVLPDLSTWEVPSTTFKLVPDKGLRRNPKGHLQSSRIHNEMDIRKKSDEKLCGVCKLVDHNWSKCPHRNYHIGQSSRSGGGCERVWEACPSHVMCGWTTIDYPPNKNDFPISEYHCMYSNESCRSKARSI